MAKYDALQRHLDALGGVRWRASFAEVERIVGAPLPASAWRCHEWWANHARGESQSRAWLRAGYRTAEVKLAAQAVTFVPNDEEVGRADATAGGGLSAGTRAWLEAHLRELTRDFRVCHETFLRSDAFGGPSEHFYVRAVARWREHSGLRTAMQDTSYLEYIYATLTAWGLHRTGSANTRLPDFPFFCHHLAELAGEVAELFRFSLIALDARLASQIGERLAQAVEGQGGLTHTRDRLVANSRALHLLLPDLAPPIDRARTLRFFFGRQSSPLPVREAYALIFTRLAEVASAHGEYIDAAVYDRARHHRCDAAHAKVVDSALIGWVLRRAAAVRSRPREDA